MTEISFMNELLQQSPLFSGMDSEAIGAFLSRNNFKVKFLPKGDVLGLSGDKLKGLYIVLKGTFRGEMIDYSGKAITIEHIHPPMLLASAFLFGKRAELPVDVIANEDSEVLFLGKESFVSALQTDALVLSNYLDIISGRAQFLARKIRFLSFKTIREKYLYYLLDQKTVAQSETFLITSTQSQLAELFGVSRPALAKVIAELNSEGYIRTKGKQVEILKPFSVET